MKKQVFTLFDLLLQHEGDQENRVALIRECEEMTYRELTDQAESLAKILSKLNAKRFDRIMIHLPKSFEEVIATFAIARLGGVFVNIHYQWSTIQLENIIKDCDPKILITTRLKAQTLFNSIPQTSELKIFIIDGKHDHPQVFSSIDFEDCDSELNSVHGPIDQDLAALIYTSGSTGRPKGVMLTHFNILSGARSVVSYLHQTDQDRVLGLLPMSFDYGMNQIMASFLVGGSVVLQSVSIPFEICESIRNKHVTGLAMVPSLWIDLIHFLNSDENLDLSSLRFVTNSGGKIPEPVLELMPKVLPQVEIFLMYGLTEAFRSTFLDPKFFSTKKGSIGRAIPNAEIYVVDPEKGICKPGEIGELIHRGSLVSKGYWKNPEATSQKFKSNIHLQPMIGEEIVVHSGDWVKMDEEGDLWFVGRKDTMIKTSGFRLSPTEVEEMIYLSGMIKEVVAFGEPDQSLGEVVHAAVSLQSFDNKFNFQQLMSFCRKTMPSYMIPKKIHLWDGDFPRTSHGKLDRQTIIQALENVKGTSYDSYIRSDQNLFNGTAESLT